MKFTCDRKKLLSVVQTAASIIPGRNVKPILQYLKLEAGPLPSGGEGLTVSATDLEVSLQSALEGCAITEPGTIVVPGARFSGLLQSATSEEVALTCTDDKVGLRMGGSKFILPTVRPDEFPTLTAFSEECGYYSVPAQALATLVRRTTFATDPGSARYMLSGVRFEIDGDTLCGIATDARRIAVQRVPLIHKQAEDSQADGILQQKGLQLLAKICSDSEDGEEAAFTIDRTNAVFRCANTTCCIRQLEGRFPKWRDALPATNRYAKAVVATEAFHAAIRQVLLIITEDHIGVEFAFGAGKLVLTTETSNGKTEIAVPVTFDAEARDVALDPRFVADFCRAVKEESFEIFIRDEGSGVQFNTAGGDYRYAVMPLSV